MCGGTGPQPGGATRPILHFKKKENQGPIDSQQFYRFRMFSSFEAQKRAFCTKPLNPGFRTANRSMPAPPPRPPPSPTKVASLLQGILLVYDITDTTSYDDVKQLMSQINQVRARADPRPGSEVVRKAVARILQRLREAAHETPLPGVSPGSGLSRSRESVLHGVPKAK